MLRERERERESNKWYMLRLQADFRGEYSCCDCKVEDSRATSTP